MNETSTTHLTSQLREMWQTRPTRIKADGKVAGVAAGIGYRYDVDPLLIRIAFVVSTIVGGAGIPLYLACWLAMPHDGGTAVPGAEADGAQDGGVKLSPLRLVALAILLVVALGAAPFDSDVGGASLLSAAVMLGGWWLLYQRRPVPTTAQSTAVTPPWWPQTQQPEQEPGTAANEAALGAPTPPAWDPLRTAPFAWDLPEPTPLPDPSRDDAPRSRLTVVFLGLALLAAAGTAAVSIAGDIAWLTPGRIAAVALAVIGLGLVIGAFLRTGQGLLIAAAPLAGFVILASLVGPMTTSGGVGGRSYQPATAADLQTEYRVGVGELRLDLRDIQLDRDRALDVGTGIGRVEVIVPEGMNIRVSCNVDIGDTNCLPDRQSADGPKLTINAHSNIGEVVVGRG